MNSPTPGGPGPWWASCSTTGEDPGLGALVIASATEESFVGNGTEFSAVLEAIGAGTGWAGWQQLDPLA